jgi:hypothetical protein
MSRFMNRVLMTIPYARHVLDCQEPYPLKPRLDLFPSVISANTPPGAALESLRLQSHTVLIVVGPVPSR